MPQKRRALLKWSLVGVTSLGVASVAHAIATGLATERVEHGFAVDAQILRNHLNVELLRTVSVVESARSLFDSSVYVDAGEFETYVLDILKQQPWVTALEWAPRVPSQSLSAHEEEVRSFGEFRYRESEVPGTTTATRSPGRPGYKVFPVDADDGDVGGWNRGPHFPVVYAVPHDATVIGLDLASEPRRRQALLESSQTGESKLTAPIDLVQFEDSEASALIFAAVRELPIASDEWSETRLLGVVLVVLRYSELMAHVRQALPAFDTEIRFWLHDGTRLLGSNTDVSPPPELGFDSELEIAGRRLRMRAAPTPTYVAARLGREPILAAWVAALITLMIGCAFSRMLTITRQSATRDRDAIMQSVLKSLSEGVVVVDREARVIFCNRVAQEMLGPIASTPPLDWTAVCGLYREDTKTPFPIEELPLVRGMRGERVEFQHVFVRNEERPEGAWLSISGSPWLDDEQRLQGGIAVIRDVSHRKRIQSDMRMMGEAVEQSSDVVFVTTQNGVVTYVNPAFERSTGWTSEEVLGRTPRLYAHEEGEAEKAGPFWSCLLAGKTYRGTLYSCRKDGSKFAADYTVTPVRDPHSSGLRLVFVSPRARQCSGASQHSS